MPKNDFWVTVYVRNGKSIRAIRKIVELAEEMKEDQPWNAQARRISAAGRYLAEHLELVPDRKGCK